jgi:hypothetical protein
MAEYLFRNVFITLLKNGTINSDTAFESDTTSKKKYYRVKV